MARAGDRDATASRSPGRGCCRTAAGRVNAAGLRFYRRLVEGLRERGIEPVATLYHWDLPQALQERGGWAERDTAERFAEYAALVAEELGDVIDDWITHQRAVGDRLPGPRVRDQGARACATGRRRCARSHHVAALARARRAGAARGGAGGAGGHHAQPGARRAQRRQPPRTDEAAERLDGHHEPLVPRPGPARRVPARTCSSCTSGAAVASTAIEDGDLSLIAAPTEFLGVNYYAPMRVRADAGRGPLEVGPAPPGPHTTAMGWEVDPDGLRRLLTRVRADYGDAGDRDHRERRVVRRPADGGQRPAWATRSAPPT